MFRCRRGPPEKQIENKQIAFEQHGLGFLKRLKKLPNYVSIDVLFRHHSAIGKADFPQALRYERSSAQKQIQLYYSSSSMMADLDLEPQGYVMRTTSTGHWFMCLLYIGIKISSRPSRCVEDRTAPSQQQLIHIKAVVLKESQMEGKESRRKETCLNGREVVELSLDTNVLVRYHGGLVLTGQPVMASVNLRANLSAKVVIIRYTKGVRWISRTVI